MPTKSYEWKPTDRAAQEIIAELVKESGLGYTGFERASDEQIGYNRVRDLVLGLKAPVRLSEFILICNVCDVDPVATLTHTIKRAKEIEAQDSLQAPNVDVSQLSEEEKVEIILEKLAQGDMSLATMRDPNKYLEREHGADDAA